MVMPETSGVHAQRAVPARYQAFPQGGSDFQGSELPVPAPVSELGNKLRPDRDHPDKQRDRRQRRRLFHENPQHVHPFR